MGLPRCYRHLANVKCLYRPACVVPVNGILIFLTLNILCCICFVDHVIIDSQ